MSLKVSYSEVSRFLVEESGRELMCVIINNDKYYFKYEKGENELYCIEFGEDIFELDLDKYFYDIKISVYTEKYSVAKYSDNKIVHYDDNMQLVNTTKAIRGISVDILTNDTLYKENIYNEKKLGFKYNEKKLGFKV